MESEAAVKAAGFTSSGFGLATAGGLLSGGFFRRARQQRQLSFDFGKGQAGMSAQEGLLPGANLFKKAKKTKIFGRKTATASKLVGGALIGRGLQQGAVALGAQETDASVVASAVAGEAAAFSVAAGVRKVARGTSFRTTFARAAKTVARKKFKLPL